MKIQHVNNSTNFGLNRGGGLKEISGQLKDGSTALVKLADNSENIIKIDVFKLKDGKLVGGWHTGKQQGIASGEILKCLDKLQDNAAEGVNFLKEFIKAMLI